MEEVVQVQEDRVYHLLLMALLVLRGRLVTVVMEV